MQSKRYDGVLCRLIDKATGRELRAGDTVTDFRGEALVLRGGRAPHKCSSQGHVTVSRPGFNPSDYGAEYYASVINAKWEA
jgi:hypothetical protein